MEEAILISIGETVFVWESLYVYGRTCVCGIVTMVMHLVDAFMCMCATGCIEVLCLAAGGP